MEPAELSRLLYCDHIEERGVDLFALACEHDLEGIVAKHKMSPYMSGDGVTSWIKVRNPNYTQIAGNPCPFFYPKVPARPRTRRSSH